MFQQHSALRIGRRARGSDASEFLGLHHVCEMTTALPDLNPTDPSVWSILEDRVCAKRHLSLKSLKEDLRPERNRLSPDDLQPIAVKFT